MQSSKLEPLINKYKFIIKTDNQEVEPNCGEALCRLFELYESSSNGNELPASDELTKNRFDEAMINLKSIIEKSKNKHLELAKSAREGVSTRARTRSRSRSNSRGSSSSRRDSADENETKENDDHHKSSASSRHHHRRDRSSEDARGTNGIAVKPSSSSSSSSASAYSKSIAINSKNYSNSYYSNVNGHDTNNPHKGYPRNNYNADPLSNPYNQANRLAYYLFFITINLTFFFIFFKQLIL